MSENKDITSNNMSATDVADSAVGMARSHWFVAIVKHNSERQSAERLEKMGITNYVPAQKEVRVWRNGRKATVERMVIPSIIFIHCTERTRREVVKLPFIFRFMTNKAGTTSGESLHKPLAIISDAEINRLKFMLGQSDIPVTITERSYQVGDKVRVIRGSLAGLEGEVFGLDATKSEVVVALENIGCARLTIDTVNLEIIDD